MDFERQIWLNHANFENKIRFYNEFNINERKISLTLHRSVLVVPEAIQTIRCFFHQLLAF